MGITTVDEIKTPRDQSRAVDSVSILNKGKQNVLYHVSVCFDSCRGSAAKDKENIDSLQITKDCVAAVSQLSDLVLKFLLLASLAVIL